MSNDRTRERSLPSERCLIGQKRNIDFNVDYGTKDYYSWYHQRKEITVDEVHTNYPYEGGPFSNRKTDIVYSDAAGKHGFDFRDPYKRLCSQYYKGVYHVEIADVPAPDPIDDECAKHGATAWNRFKPAKPAVSLSVAIAELKDAPSLIFKKLDKFRNLGSNYLAYQFGWKPFLSDLRCWYDSIVHIDKIVSQLCRDNGKRVRRGGTLFSHQNFSEKSTNPHLVPLSLATNVTSVIRRSDYERCWFKGSFRYYIPGLESKKWGRARAVLKAWDLEIGPEQVYNLIPFSWLVDWFSNVGDVIGNYASSLEDNLVADYAYIMLHKRSFVETITNFKTSWKGTYGGTPVITPHVASATVITESKSRVAADPFGFNFGFDGLSAYQTSILSALGISRLKF